MTISDPLIIRYFELVTDLHPDEIREIKNKLEQNLCNPRDVKMQLALEIIRLYHGEAAADEAQKHFVTVFQKKEVPDSAIELKLTSEFCSNGLTDLVRIITIAGFASSKSEARRLILQGGVKVNGTRVSDMLVPGLSDGDVIQVGKKNFIKLLL